MTRTAKLSIVWGCVGLVLAVLAIPTARPLRIGWEFYRLHESGERERAQVLHKIDNATLALEITQGSHAGEVCNAETSLSIYQVTEVGTTLEVVYLDSRPGSCELSSTLAASFEFLWILAAGAALLLALVIGLGIVASRSFTQEVRLPRRMPSATQRVSCPVCGKAMDEGYLAILSGIHWRNRGQPIGLPNALSGLPGTVGWRGRPRLHAFRCSPCEIVTFQYGTAPDRGARDERQP